MPDAVPGAGMRLHHFGTAKAPRNRRRLLLLLTLLVVTAWGALSVRRGDVVLEELGEQTVALLRAVPPLISRGWQRVNGSLQELRAPPQPS